jgi:molybdopterin converting factor small subunit
MSIKIIMGPSLQYHIGNKEMVEVQGKTVGECLDDLMGKYPDIKKYLFDRNGIFMVMAILNGAMLLEKELSKRVSDGDELSLIQIVGGG